MKTYGLSITVNHTPPTFKQLVELGQRALCKAVYNPSYTS